MPKTCLYCQKPIDDMSPLAKFCKPSHRVAYSQARRLIEPLMAEIETLKARVKQLESDLEVERAYIKELETGSHADGPVYEQIDDGW